MILTVIVTGVSGSYSAYIEVLMLEMPAEEIAKMLERPVDEVRLMGLQILNALVHMDTGEYF